MCLKNGWIMSVEISEKQQDKLNGHVAVYVRNHNLGPSDYYRIVQYLDFERYDIVIHDALPDCLFKLNLNIKPSIFKKIFQAFLYLVIYVRRLVSLLYDAKSNVRMVIVQREVFPHMITPLSYTILKRVLMNAEVVWDFDDDIYSGEISARESSLLEKSSNRIVVTNSFLKSRINVNYQDKVTLLPTSDKLAEENEVYDLLKQREKDYEKIVRLVWTGTASNLINLDIVCQTLDELGLELKNHGKELQLYVVSNIPYAYNASNYEVINVKWSRDVAKDVIKNSHVGIMPLYDTEYSKGKGGFKLIQYISCGLAVVASAVGFNREIIGDDQYGFCCDTSKDWSDALRCLLMDKTCWKRYSDLSYENYLQNFSRDKNKQFWNEVILKN